MLFHHPRHLHLHCFTETQNLVSGWSKQFTGLLNSLYWRLLLSYMPTCSPDNPGTLVRVPLFLKARLGQMMNAFSDKKISRMFTNEKMAFFASLLDFCSLQNMNRIIDSGKKTFRRKKYEEKRKQMWNFFPFNHRNSIFKHF